MKQSNKLTSAKLELILHGWLEVELDTVDSAVRGASSRSNGRTAWCLCWRSTGLRGHTELGADRADRRKHGVFGGEILLQAVLALRRAAGEASNGTSCCADSAGSYDFTLGADHLDDRGAISICSIDLFGVVAKWVVAVTLLLAHGGLPRHRTARARSRSSTGHGKGIATALAALTEVGKELSDRTQRQTRRVGRGSRASLAFSTSPDLLLLVIELISLGVSPLLEAEEDDAGNGADHADYADGQSRLSSDAHASRRLRNRRVCGGIGGRESAGRLVLGGGGHEEAVVIDGRRWGVDGLGQAGRGLLGCFGGGVLLRRGVGDE